MSRPLTSLSSLRHALPCVPSSSRAFHTSPAVAKGKIVKVLTQEQIRRKERKAAYREQKAPGKPDYILGDIVSSLDRRGRRTEESEVLVSTWEDCKLAKCITHPKIVWAQPIPEYAAGEKPENFLPGLSENDKAFLFGAVPHVSTALQYDPELHGEARDQKVKDAIASQEKQTEMMYRILDLRNASRSQINAHNRQRIIEEFGGGIDSGSAFVQAALLTLKIRGLNEHILEHRQDIHNRRNLRLLIMARARHLKYIKRKHKDQYRSFLDDIGVHPRTVEGELVTRL